MLKQLAAAVVVATMLAAPAAAGPMEDGGLAYLQGDFAEAMSNWEPLAEQGDVSAQWHLGRMYAQGQGVPRDYVEAVKWYRLAAKHDFAWPSPSTFAQFALGEMYYNGAGVSQDYAEAVKWFRLAAERGHSSAQHGLGVLYENK